MVSSSLGMANPQPEHGNSDGSCVFCLRGFCPLGLALGGRVSASTTPGPARFPLWQARPRSDGEARALEPSGPQVSAAIRFLSSNPCRPLRTGLGLLRRSFCHPAQEPATVKYAGFFPVAVGPRFFLLVPETAWRRAAEPRTDLEFARKAKFDTSSTNQRTAPGSIPDTSRRSRSLSSRSNDAEFRRRAGSKQQPGGRSRIWFRRVLVLEDP